MMCQDKVAVVTGAAGDGMGRSIALTLAREGAEVVVNYLTSEDNANRIVEHITGQGGSAIAVCADIMQQDQCKALVEASSQAFGQVDICIVGPGAGWHQEPIDKLDAAASLDDVQKEVSPIYNLMPLILPGMYERKWGRLIGLALHPCKLPPAYAYNSAKCARSSALLRAHDAAWQHGVTVNVIAPGPVNHLSSLAEAIELCAHGDAWQSRTNVTPQDVAEGVALLCSESGRFISGCELPYMFH
jgi:NAD(P)-dependent dehydrogenase (short-subunit alcohol dehydrogenase family)